AQPHLVSQQNANTSSLTDVAVATQPQHEISNKSSILHLRLVFPPAKCFRAVLPVTSDSLNEMLPTQHIRYSLENRILKCCFLELKLGRCETVGELRLFELQTSEPQPTCTRSRAVKRLLAASFPASGREVALACLEQFCFCFMAVELF